MGFRNVLCAAVAGIYLLASCDPAPRPEKEYSWRANHGSDFQGLAFTGIDPDYSSSDGFYYDFESGLVSRTVMAQGGDPVLAWLEDTLYFFNRRADLRNFFRIDLSDHSADVASSVAFRARSEGAPQKVVSLLNGNFLVIEMASTLSPGGRVFVIDPSDGSQVGTELSFVVPGNSPFHPVDLVEQYVNGDRVIFVSHKGIHILTHPTMIVQANDSQAVFAIKDSPQGPEVMFDGNPVARPAASDPRFVSKNSQGFLLGGLCYSALNNGGKPCVQAFEKFSPSAAVSQKRALSDRTDLSMERVTMLGGLDQGFSENTFLASVRGDVENDGTFKNFIGEFALNWSEKTWTVKSLYLHPQDYPGGYLFKSEPSSQMIYFGERDKEKEHYFLKSLDRSGRTDSLSLDRIPYNGVFVR